jgi:hypothetical protein
MIRNLMINSYIVSYGLNDFCKRFFVSLLCELMNFQMMNFLFSSLLGYNEIDAYW